jgi:putative membrane protein
MPARVVPVATDVAGSRTATRAAQPADLALAKTLMVLTDGESKWLMLIDWYFGWGWFLWFGIVFLLFSSLGNWGYTYRAHQKYDKPPRKEAFDILDARYAKGELSHEEYGRMKSEIAKE